MSNYIKAIVGLAAVPLALISWHFGTVLGLFGSPPQTRNEFFVRLGVIVIAFIVSSLIVATRMARKEGESALEPDEREELVGVKAERNGGWAISVGIIVLMWFVFQSPSPMAIANILLAILWVGELVKITTALAYLRGGT